MITSETYRIRRILLRQKVSSGNILLLSSPWVPRNYGANTYPFHQESTFLYYTGLSCANAALWIDASGEETLFLPPQDADDVIWMGSQASPEELLQRASIHAWQPFEKLKKVLKSVDLVHFLPPFDPQHKLLLCEYLQLPVSALSRSASEELVEAVVLQRSIKSADEIAELEEAINLTSQMLESAQAVIAPGRKETEVAAALLMPALSHNRQQAFSPIVTVHGETLHNEPSENVLKAGDILLIDCGCESALGYCADITRCYPVTKFSSEQREIYQLVLSMQTCAILESSNPHATQRDVHLAACLRMAEGLKDLGFMRGNPSDIVEQGAHALFMPHGIGHMLGLDAHDMENLGDIVGYAKGQKRSTQFGLNALRLDRELLPGFVFTIEPGIYFIPELIRRWKAQNVFSEYINYSKLENYMQFGGIRIEDDVLKTPEGSRVLGCGISKLPPL